MAEENWGADNMTLLISLLPGNSNKEKLYAFKIIQSFQKDLLV